MVDSAMQEYCDSISRNVGTLCIAEKNIVVV